MTKRVYSRVQTAEMKFLRIQAASRKDKFCETEIYKCLQRQAAAFSCEDVSAALVSQLRKEPQEGSIVKYFLPLN